jgi:hypothetical protein
MRLALAAAAATAFAVAPTPVSQARPCVNGVVPGNPFITNCNLPDPGPRVRGAAPDAGAIIACRNWPGCLSWYVNGP